MLEKFTASRKTVHKGSGYRHIYIEVGLKPVFFRRGSVNCYKDNCYQGKLGLKQYT